MVNRKVIVHGIERAMVWHTEYLVGSATIHDRGEVMEVEFSQHPDQTTWTANSVWVNGRPLFESKVGSRPRRVLSGWVERAVNKSASELGHGEVTGSCSRKSEMRHAGSSECSR